MSQSKEFEYSPEQKKTIYKCLYQAAIEAQRDEDAAIETASYFLNFITQLNDVSIFSTRIHNLKTGPDFEHERAKINNRLDFLKSILDEIKPSESVKHLLDKEPLVYGEYGPARDEVVCALYLKRELMRSELEAYFVSHYFHRKIRSTEFDMDRVALGNSKKSELARTNKEYICDILHYWLRARNIDISQMKWSENGPVERYLRAVCDPVFAFYIQKDKPYSGKQYTIYINKIIEEIT